MHSLDRPRLTITSLLPALVALASATPWQSPYAPPARRSTPQTRKAKSRRRRNQIAKQSRRRNRA